MPHPLLFLKTVHFLYGLLLVFCLPSLGQTTYYSRNGATAPRNWDEADSWTLNADGSGSAAAVPGRTDNVVILSGHNIIVDNAADNGSAGVSADGLAQANVGAFAASGTANFYHTGNIFVRNGGTLTTTRAMIGGTLTVDGTLSASADLIIVGRLEITSTATSSIGDDLILTGFSETLIFNTSTSSDDLYMDHVDAQLCGDNTVNLGDIIQYLNGATSDQICTGMQITGCATCPTNGTGPNTLGTSQQLLKTGATWRYLDDGTDQGTAWQASGFDDSGWTVGNAELGYGDGDETTTVSFGPDANNKYTTTYFRTTFFVEDRANYTKIKANVNYDDGIIIYINGNEVIRDNMPAGTITSSTFASGVVPNENQFKEFSLSVFDLINGTNSIAVEIHQANLTSSDISFDMELIGSFSNELVARGETWNYLDDGSDQGSLWTGTSFDDSGWSSGNAELGYGDGDETTTVSFGPDSNNKYPTTYFRKTFTNADASVYALKVGLRRDDGAIVYLNGNEIVRDNMPAGAIGYLDFASGAIGGTDESTYYIFEVDPADLVVGTNTLAVEVHQANATSSDISFDMYLETVQAGVLLPVSLIHFAGSFDGNIVTLDWSTALETQNEFFLVERSRNGKDFSTLTKIAGAGSSNAVMRYSTTDFSPLADELYYRLSQFDFNGQQKILETIYVSDDKATSVVVDLYPNPASSRIFVRTNDHTPPIRIQLYDLIGVIHHTPITHQNNQTILDVANLKSGVYILQVNHHGHIFSEMIIIK